MKKPMKEEEEEQSLRLYITSSAGLLGVQGFGLRLSDSFESAVYIIGLGALADGCGHGIIDIGLGFGQTRGYALDGE